MFNAATKCGFATQSARAVGVLLVTCAAAAAALAQAEEWPIKEFEVINVAPLNIEDYDRTPLERLLIKASRLLPNDIEAAGLRTVSSDSDHADAMRGMETMLGRTARELEQWRFPPPLLEPVVTRNGRPMFRTYFLASIPGAAGQYHFPTCVPPPSAETIMTLSAAGLLRTIERQSADGTTREAVTLTEAGLQTLSHELFHAVQFAMPFYENAKCGNEVGAWITEGTARAVGYDITRSLGTGLSSVPGDVVWGRRNYSEPLAVPAIMNTDQAYNTSSFWRYLAELYTTGRPGPAPVSDLDYSYLADFLSSRPSGRDCVQKGDPCDTEIARLDGWLKSTFGGKGLREHLPRFLAAYVHYGEARGRLGTAKDRNDAWRGASFEEGCKSVELSPVIEIDSVAYGGLSWDDTVSVKDTAARCWSIEPVDFQNDAIGVEVEVRLPSDRALSQLVAVRASRDGAEVSVQEAIVEVNQMTGEPRARFMFPFHNGEQTPFLLVNVAHDAQTTTPIENMPIRFTVVRSYATITSMTGPSGADVDQPLGMVFDNVTPGVLIDAAITRYNYDPRLTEPCVLRKLGLSNARGDGLSFMLDHEGPIGPGEYPVADATQHRYPDPLPPGQVSAAFVLGFLNQPPAQQLQQFVGVAGTLTVQSVSGLLVTGVLDVVGENKRAKLIRQGLEEPPANYLPGAVIRVEFGLVMHDPGDPVNNSAAYDCLSSEASESQAATGSAPTSGRPGGSESDPARDAGGTSSDGARGNAQDDSPQSGTEATFPDSAAGPVRPSKADVASLGPGEARWILVEAEGRSDLSFYGSDVDGSAGAAFSCYGADNPALLSLFKGASAQTAELGLSVITAAGIPEGATGAYRIDQATYLFGGGTLSWRGPASLELSRHDASTDPGARRIVGRIVGLSVLDHQTRAPIPIRAEFDVNAACAPFSPGR